METRETTSTGQPNETEVLRLKMAGRQAAKGRTPVRFHDVRQLERRTRALRERLLHLQERQNLPAELRRELTAGFRLLRTAMRETREMPRSMKEHPGLADSQGTVVPRVLLVAEEYLSAAMDAFSEAGLAGFLEGYQFEAELEMDEIWGLKPALQFELLERIVDADSARMATLLSSLRLTGEAPWKEIFEAVSVVDMVLSSTPRSEFSAMDFESRELYRRSVSDISRRSALSEREVAELAAHLARDAVQASDGSPAVERRCAVGYYLVDAGLPLLRAAAGYKPGLKQRLRELVLTYPSGFYLIGIEVVTLAIVYGLLSGLDSLTPVLAGFFFLLLPATQAAVDFMNNFTSYLVKPRVIPKLDFSEGIPEELTTVVAVPTLLLNEAQVKNLILDLEIRYLANRDPNLFFALLTDHPDADRPVDQRDTLAEVCRGMVDDLNRRHGHDGRTPFYLFHRHRIFNPSEGRWMGWERKRGKLLDLNQYLQGKFDSFPLKTGNLAALRRVKYVITLDSDTQLPRDSAAWLVGAMAHPLNRPVLHPQTGMVVEGYGILQPRIGVSIHSSTQSRLAALYSGQTGFDIYTRAISDVYQDLFGEGIFTGKGIYDVEAVYTSLQQRFPENALLSHDLIEGSYARAGLVSDIELIDDYPSHFSAWSRRKHRWVRGDWQILRWLLPAVPDFSGNYAPNPTSLISRWKIVDNLRRSLFEPATLLLLLAGWLYLPEQPWKWTAASVAMWLAPVYANLLFSLLRAPWRSRALVAWARDLLRSVINGHLIAVAGLIFLLHQSLLALDAIVRSVLRVFVTRRKLLEWETAAESETASRRRATVDVYLAWSPLLAAWLLALVWLARPSALPVALPFIAVWVLAPAVSSWLNRAPRNARRELSQEDTELLRDSAFRMLRFFRAFSNERNHFLIPDNVTEAGEAAERLSPTNAGVLLNSWIAAVLFGQCTLEEFAASIGRTLDTLSALPKHRGHLFNWYDNRTLRPLEPRFVSTVDSGNLAACLWTLAQACRSFADESPSVRGVTPDAAERLQALASRCERMVADMDFRFLFDRRRKLLSVGYDASAGRAGNSFYDLLASEARIAAFIAIAKGDIPQEAWFHLGRRQTIAEGRQLLVSWTGTMFEYLMPLLWMRHYGATILSDTVRAAVAVQREYARRAGVPWGISEAASFAPEGEGYAYAAYGVPSLAMRQPQPDEPLVVSPYSTFLALPLEPHAAAANLRRMAELGWMGEYGFFESVDYSRPGGETMRMWMAHHQGMSLLAVCNLLHDSALQRYFHAEPHVLATELLLHERVPTAVRAEAEELPPAAA